MKLGNREKIIAVSVVALGLIAGLHFVVFAPKAADFQEAVRAYTDARGQLDSVGQPPPEPEIAAFQERTWDYQLRLMNFIRDANLIIPEGFSIPVVEEVIVPVEGEEGYEEVYEDPAMTMGMGGMFGPWGMGGPGMGMGGTAAATAIAEKEFDPLTPEQKEALASKLADLERLRDQGAPTRLTFMESETQWNILRQLPDAIRRGNVDVADLIRALEGIDMLIKQSGEGSRMRYDRQTQYVGELRRIGLDQVRRQGLTPNPQAYQLLNSRNSASILRDYGNLAAVLHTVNRINLIMQAVPRESLNIRTDREYFARLEDLLRLDTADETYRASDITYIKWQMVAYDALKQMDALLDLINMAREANVFEVSSVKFWEPVDVEWIDPAAEPAEVDPALAGYDPMGGMGGMFGDPSMMMMDPTMMMGDPTMMGGPWGMGMGMGMQPAGPTGEVVGTSTPIEIEVRGTNAAVMAFVHLVTHSRRLYAIDSIQISAVSGQANVEVSARVVVHVMSRLKNTGFQLTQAQYEQRMAVIQGGEGPVTSGIAVVDPTMGMGTPEQPGVLVP